MKASPLEDILPLSPMQEGMLVNTLLDPDSGVDFEQLVYRFDGPLRVPALEVAWQAVVARHSALRARLVWQGVDRPLQLIERVVRVPFAEFDWTDADDDFSPRLGEWLETDRTAGIELGRAPLLRVSVFRLSPVRHVMVMSFHHLLLDGWSVRLLLRDLLTFYRAETDGRPAVMEPAPKYSSFIHWLGSKDADAAQRYWRSELGDFSAPTRVGSDRPTGEVGFATVDLTMTEAETAKLRQFARAQRVTVNTLVQGALALLLSRYAGESDVVFGATLSTRPPEADQVESMVGLMINTLPLRVRVDQAAPVGPWLRSVQQAQVRLQQFDYTPLVLAASSSAVPQGTPLFESLLVFENYPATRADDQLPAGLELTTIDAREQTGYPLTILASVRDLLRMAITYDRSRFAADQADRLAGHLHAVLAGLVADAAGLVADVPLLTSAEVDRMVTGWNDNASAPRPARLLHEAVADRVERQPAATALIDTEGARLTYRELDRRANQLAHRLQGMGIGPGSTVGLCLPRSAETIVALLATLKAGAAYLPLDPNHPVERLEFMLSDSGASAVVTTESTRSVLGCRGDTLCLADVRWAELPEESPLAALAQCSPAYVIYTSGSTGAPKAVVVSHGSVVEVLRSSIEVLPIGADDVVLAAATIGFDPSILEMFGTLMAGGTVVVASHGRLTEPSIVDGLIADHGVTIMQATPTVWREIVHNAKALDQVHVLIGGEVLTEDLESALRKAARRVTNLYGPTETTIWSTTAEVTGRRTGVGRPMANTRVYVLDDQLGPLPVGVPGELYIAGERLAIGYRDRPALTADRYLPCPFGGSGARMYRTGDVVRWTADGDLEFLGRADHQVKVRGIRIEPGEIESALLALEGVSLAVVMVREDVPGDQRLVAYLAGAGHPPVPELRAQLGRTLPEHMIPSAFVSLPDLPRTSSGKVNRPALPAPEAERPELGVAFRAPRTGLERQIAEIFATVLGAAAVGADDDFFALGGHSLLATRVVSRLARDCGLEVSLRGLFDNPTVAGLAALGTGADLTAEQPIERADRGVPLPLSSGQRRLWFLDQLAPGSVEYVVPLIQRLHGELDVAALRSAWAQVVARHEVLRTSFEATPGGPEQVVAVVADAVPVELPVLAAVEAEVDAVIERLVGAPFELAGAPLWRVALIEVSPREHVFVLALHHSVTDGWSAGILIRELGACYRAALANTVPELPELAIQYGDFAAWQQERLSGPLVEEQLPYWRRTLAGIEPLELPTDRPRPAIRSAAGASIDFTVPPAVAEGLRALAQERQASLFMVLLAGLQALLARYCGQSDIAVGTPIANRNKVDVEPLIGFFVNTLVLRTGLDGDPTFAELVDRVRDVTLGAYEHQDLPFERLVEELVPVRDLSRLPLFQVMLSVNNTEPVAWELPGVEVTDRPHATESVNADLVAAFHDGPAGLRATLRYSVALFDEDRVDRMRAHLTTLLTAAAANPDRRLSDLPLLPAAEYREIVRDWNDSAADYPADKCMHELFEARVAEQPGAVAVVGADGLRLTYAELNERANRLAHHLRGLGIGPEQRVGICVSPSVEALAGILGIMKAGAAYVPLDPEHPVERLEFMLTDTGAEWVLADHPGSAGLPGSYRDRTILLDPEVSAARGEPASNPGVRTRSDLLAYVIYTSGSTGKPKGVLVPHRGLVNYLWWAIEGYGLEGDAGAPMLGSLAYDLAMPNYFLPLIGGKSVTLLPAERSLDSLRELLSAPGDFSLLKITPGHLDLLRGTLDERAKLDSVRTYVVGADEVRPETMAGWQRIAPGARVINEYGPTETVVGCSIYVADERFDPSSPVPIGKPIANIRMYVLDEAMNPVPVGSAGELYIGGDGVARGYLNRAAVTAERFVPDPFEPGRLYRTGDRARYRADGDLDFLGRLDHQVKIRGFRVELGEIEARLLLHEAVSEAVVIARDDMTGGRRLVAYLVAAGEPTVAELREWLSAALPDYMVPANYVLLAEMPLSANRKVDRRELPAPDSARPEVGAGFFGPRSDVERRIAEVWCAVLGVGRIGVFDDFFELGGHSLLAVEVVSRLRAGHGISVPLRTMFQTRDIAGLAAAVDAGGKSARGELVRLNGGGASRTVFCVHEGTGNITGYYDLARLLEPDTTLIGIEYDASLATAEVAPGERLSALAATYAGLIREHQPDGPYRLCGWSAGGLIAYEIGAQLSASGARVDWVGVIDCPPEVRCTDEPDPLFTRAIALAVRIDDGDWAGQAKETLAEPLRKAGLRPETVELGKAEVLETLHRRHFLHGAQRAYRTGPAALPLSVLRAADGDLDQATVEQWREYAPQTAFQQASGDHLSVMTPPHVDEVAQWLRNGVRS